MIITVPVTTSGSASFQPDAPFRCSRSRLAASATGFEVSPDGRRVLVRMVTPAAPQPLMIVLNWMALLKN